MTEKKDEKTPCGPSPDSVFGGLSSVRRIDRIRKSVINRVVMSSDWWQGAGDDLDGTGFSSSNHAMRHLMYRTRVRQRQVITRLLDASTAAIHSSTRGSELLSSLWPESI